VGRRDLIECQEARPRRANQIGHHGGFGRGDGRGQSGDAEPALLGRGYSDDWSVSTTEQETYADFTLLHDGRIR
jgi:hypothetical protein